MHFTGLRAVYRHDLQADLMSNSLVHAARHSSSIWTPLPEQSNNVAEQSSSSSVKVVLPPRNALSTSRLEKVETLAQENVMIQRKGSKYTHVL